MAEAIILEPLVIDPFLRRRLRGWTNSTGHYVPPEHPDCWDPDVREWWIYFVQARGGGPIKIGRTRNLGQRLGFIQIGYPFDRLNYVGLRIGTAGTERKLHREFALFRMQGEWFRPVEELTAYIRMWPREPGEPI